MQSLLQVKYYSSILQVKYYPSIDGTSKYAVFIAHKVLPQYQYIASKVLPQSCRYICSLYCGCSLYCRQRITQYIAGKLLLQYRWYI